MPETIDLNNVQGLIVRGYTHPYSRHLLFSFPTASATRFLADLLPLVTTAQDWGGAKPATLLNIGLTFAGLKVLGLGQDILSAFPAEFQCLPEAEVLRDFGPSSSEHWWEDQPELTSKIHCLVNCYALHSDTEADAFANHVRASATASSVQELFPRKSGKAIAGFQPSDRRVHFGYRDGISQPDVIWGDEAVGTVPANRVDFRHFLLGYSNSQVSSCPNSGKAGELVRDGAYLVLRWIQQDVASFNRFLEAQAQHLISSDPAADISHQREWTAAKLVGRWRDGSPLVLAPEAPNSQLAESNEFGFASLDPDGLRCPFSAHIRITNPRDQQLDPLQTFLPRIIRRGVPYGPPLLGSQDDGTDRGLVGLFICASIARQFERVLIWQNVNNFSRVFTNPHTQDPLFANRQTPNAAITFEIPNASGAVEIGPLPQFITTKGTAYLLLPSVSTLRQLSS